MTTYIHPDALSKFKEDIRGKQLFLLFYSASIDPKEKVFCIEISIEAFETLLLSAKVKTFDVDFGRIVTIENIKS